LFYIDESGDAGVSGSRTYSLGCAVVVAEDWPTRFDQMIAFRRHLNRTYGVPVRAEIKANFLLRNGGPFRALALPEATRRSIYAQSLRYARRPLGLHCFGVVVNKQNLASQSPGLDPRDVAWDWLFQRIERYTHYNSTHAVLIHDEGDQLRVRGLARKARRAGSAGSRLGTGVLRVPFGKLIDDPISRQSHQSYFLQLADLLAYAAFRRRYPPPSIPGQTAIVPQTMWDELGSAAYAPVNQYSGGPPGIVHGP
jgi:hypothetical protein